MANVGNFKCYYGYSQHYKPYNVTIAGINKYFTFSRGMYGQIVVFSTEIIDENLKITKMEVELITRWGYDKDSLKHCGNEFPRGLFSKLYVIMY